MTPSRRAVLAALAAAAGAASGRAVQAQPARVIRVSTGPSDSYAAPFYGIDGGIFARAGLDVELTLIPNGAASAAAMAGNAIDVAIGDPLNVAHAVSSGLPLALFAGSGLYLSDAPTTALYVTKTSPIRVAKDLEGGIIAAVALASVSALGLRQWLAQGGADPNKVRIIEMPFPAMKAALVRGDVSAALLSEPFMTDAVDAARILGKPFDAIAREFYITAWFAEREWLTKNADLARKLREAIYDTARWANGHHAESAAILSKYTKLDPTRVSSMTRVRFATSVDPKLVQPVLDVAYNFQLLDRPVRAADIIAS